MAETQENKDSTLTFDIIVLNSILRMRDAKAAGDSESYFTYCTFALQLLLPHLSRASRGAVEADYKAFEAEINKLKEDKQLNLESAKAMIRELKRAWADAHSVYIFASLSRVGIVKIREEGVLLADLDLDQLALVVRGKQEGLIKTVEKIAGAGE